MLNFWQNQFLLITQLWFPSFCIKSAVLAYFQGYMWTVVTADLVWALAITESCWSLESGVACKIC